MGDNITKQDQSLEKIVSNDVDQAIELGHKYAQQGREDKFIRLAVLLEKQYGHDTARKLAYHDTVSALYRDQIDSNRITATNHFAFVLYKRGYDNKIVDSLASTVNIALYRMALRAGRFEAAKEVRTKNDQSNRSGTETFKPIDALEVLNVEKEKLEPSRGAILEEIYDEYGQLGYEAAAQLIEYDEPDLIKIVVENENQDTQGRLGAYAARKGRLRALNTFLDTLKQYDNVSRYFDSGGVARTIQNGHVEPLLRILEVFDDLRGSAIDCAISANRGRILEAMVERNLVPKNKATRVRTYLREHDRLSDKKNVKLAAINA